MRDYELENRLQKALDGGSNVWVVGDVHGHFKTLELLVQKFHLREEDSVVMLGDLIDRGLDLLMVKYVGESENIHTMPNHEQMMIDGFDQKIFQRFEHRRGIWYHNGGLTLRHLHWLYGGEKGALRERQRT